MVISKIFYALLFAGVVGFATPVKLRTSNEDFDPREYLKSYGYLNDENDSDSDSDTYPVMYRTHGDPYTDAIKKFQKLRGLEETGVIDDVTKQYMQRERCGVADIVQDFSTNTNTMHASLSTRRNKSFLTYRISSFASYTQLSRTIQESIIDDAFHEWSKYIPLTFEKVCEVCPANIVVDFIDDKGGYHVDTVFDAIELQRGNYVKVNVKNDRFSTKSEYAHASLAGRASPRFIHINKKFNFTDRYIRNEK